jgi:hypothetical protein
MKTAKLMTLLEKAKMVPLREQHIKPSDDVITLAVAWARDEISYKQAAIALKGGHAKMTAYVALARALREAVRQGILK